MDKSSIYPNYKNGASGFSKLAVLAVVPLSLVLQGCYMKTRTCINNEDCLPYGGFVYFCRLVKTFVSVIDPDEPMTMFCTIDGICEEVGGDFIPNPDPTAGGPGNPPGQVDPRTICWDPLDDSDTYGQEYCSENPNFCVECQPVFYECNTADVDDRRCLPVVCDPRECEQGNGYACVNSAQCHCSNSQCASDNDRSSLFKGNEFICDVQGPNGNCGCRNSRCPRGLSCGAVGGLSGCGCTDQGCENEFGSNWRCNSSRTACEQFGNNDPQPPPTQTCFDFLCTNGAGQLDPGFRCPIPTSNQNDCVCSQTANYCTGGGRQCLNNDNGQQVCDVPCSQSDCGGTNSGYTCTGALFNQGCVCNTSTCNGERECRPFDLGNGDERPDFINPGQDICAEPIVEECNDQADCQADISGFKCRTSSLEDGCVCDPNVFCTGTRECRDREQGEPLPSLPGVVDGDQICADIPIPPPPQCDDNETCGFDSGSGYSCLDAANSPDCVCDDSCGQGENDDRVCRAYDQSNGDELPDFPLSGDNICADPLPSTPLCDNEDTCGSPGSGYVCVDPETSDQCMCDTDTCELLELVCRDPVGEEAPAFPSEEICAGKLCTDFYCQTTNDGPEFRCVDLTDPDQSEACICDTDQCEAGFSCEEGDLEDGCTCDDELCPLLDGIFECFYPGGDETVPRQCGLPEFECEIDECLEREPPVFACQFPEDECLCDADRCFAWGQGQPEGDRYAFICDETYDGCRPDYGNDAFDPSDPRCDNPNNTSLPTLEPDSCTVSCEEYGCPYCFWSEGEEGKLVCTACDGSDRLSLDGEGNTCVDECLAGICCPEGYGIPPAITLSILNGEREDALTLDDCKEVQFPDTEYCETDAECRTGAGFGCNVEDPPGFCECSDELCPLVEDGHDCDSNDRSKCECFDTTCEAIGVSRGYQGWGCTGDGGAGGDCQCTEAKCRAYGIANDDGNENWVCDGNQERCFDPDAPFFPGDLQCPPGSARSNLPPYECDFDCSTLDTNGGCSFCNYNSGWNAGEGRYECEACDPSRDLVLQFSGTSGELTCVESEFCFGSSTDGPCCQANQGVPFGSPFNGGSCVNAIFRCAEPDQNPTDCASGLQCVDDVESGYNVCQCEANLPCGDQDGDERAFMCSADGFTCSCNQDACESLESGNPNAFACGADGLCGCDDTVCQDPSLPEGNAFAGFCVSPDECAPLDGPFLAGDRDCPIGFTTAPNGVECAFDCNQASLSGNKDFCRFLEEEPVTVACDPTTGQLLQFSDGNGEGQEFRACVDPEFCDGSLCCPWGFGVLPRADLSSTEACQQAIFPCEVGGDNCKDPEFECVNDPAEGTFVNGICRCADGCEAEDGFKCSADGHTCGCFVDLGDGFVDTCTAEFPANSCQANVCTCDVDNCPVEQANGVCQFGECVDSNLPFLAGDLECPPGQATRPGDAPGTCGYKCNQIGDENHFCSWDGLPEGSEPAIIACDPSSGMRLQAYENNQRLCIPAEECDYEYSPCCPANHGIRSGTTYETEGPQDFLSACELAIFPCDNGENCGSEFVCTNPNPDFPDAPRGTCDCNDSTCDADGIGCTADGYDCTCDPDDRAICEVTPGFACLPDGGCGCDFESCRTPSESGGNGFVDGYCQWNPEAAPEPRFECQDPANADFLVGEPGCFEMTGKLGMVSSDPFGNPGTCDYDCNQNNQAGDEDINFCSFLNGGNSPELIACDPSDGKRFAWRTSGEKACVDFQECEYDEIYCCAIGQGMTPGSQPDTLDPLASCRDAIFPCESSSNCAEGNVCEGENDPDGGKCECSETLCDDGIGGFECKTGPGGDVDQCLCTEEGQFSCKLEGTGWGCLGNGDCGCINDLGYCNDPTGEHGFLGGYCENNVCIDPSGPLRVREGECPPGLVTQPGFGGECGYDCLSETGAKFCSFAVNENTADVLACDPTTNQRLIYYEGGVRGCVDFEECQNEAECCPLYKGMPPGPVPEGMEPMDWCTDVIFPCDINNGNAGDDDCGRGSVCDASADAHPDYGECECDMEHCNDGVEGFQCTTETVDDPDRDREVCGCIPGTEEHQCGAGGNGFDCKPDGECGCTELSCEAVYPGGYCAFDEDAGEELCMDPANTPLTVRELGCPLGFAKLPGSDICDQNCNANNDETNFCAYDAEGNQFVTACDPKSGQRLVIYENGSRACVDFEDCEYNNCCPDKQGMPPRDPLDLVGAPLALCQDVIFPCENDDGDCGRGTTCVDDSVEPGFGECECDAADTCPGLGGFYCTEGIGEVGVIQCTCNPNDTGDDLCKDEGIGYGCAANGECECLAEVCGEPSLSGFARGQCVFDEENIRGKCVDLSDGALTVREQGCEAGFAKQDPSGACDYDCNQFNGDNYTNFCSFPVDSVSPETIACDPTSGQLLAYYAESGTRACVDAGDCQGDQFCCPRGKGMVQGEPDGEPSEWCTDVEFPCAIGSGIDQCGDGSTCDDTEVDTNYGLCECNASSCTDGGFFCNADREVAQCECNESDTSDPAFPLCSAQGDGFGCLDAYECGCEPSACTAHGDAIVGSASFYQCLSKDAFEGAVHDVECVDPETEFDANYGCGEDLGRDSNGDCTVVCSEANPFNEWCTGCGYSEDQEITICTACEAGYVLKATEFGNECVADEDAQYSCTDQSSGNEVCCASGKGRPISATDLDPGYCMPLANPAPAASSFIQSRVGN